MNSLAVVQFPSPNRQTKKVVKPVKGVYEKQRGSGVWWIRYADHIGRIRREKVGTRASAISLYQKRKTEVLEGRKFPERLRDRGVSFAALAQDALEYSKAHKISYAQDCHRMKNLIQGFGVRAAESIKSLDIERWLNSQTELNKWKPATANRYKALFSLTFRLGIENGKIESNPARMVRRRREDNGRIRWLSDEEEKALRAILQKEFAQHLPELEIALNTGLRRSEQFRLTWDCVNFAQRLLTIPRTKNGETRHLPLNSKALAVLESLQKTKTAVSDRVFVDVHGSPLIGTRHWFDKAVKAAAITDFTWHCLRHTFASRLVMAGVDLRTVQELMGHKTIQMTCRYAHLAPQHTLAAVERLCVTPHHKKSSSKTNRRSKSRTRKQQKE